MQQSPKKMVLMHVFKCRRARCFKPIPITDEELDSWRKGNHIELFGFCKDELTDLIVNHNCISILLWRGFAKDIN